MMHESPAANSATRLFRGEPVLRWTLRRIARAAQVKSVAVLCWEDQLDAVASEAGTAFVMAKGPRSPLPELDAITAARRWSDGWRGGLLSSCDFDLGFHGPWFSELSKNVGSDGVLLVDPSAALVDPSLLDGLITHADAHPEVELFFVPAAPGLGGALFRTGLLDRLAAAKVHGGRLLHYLPDQLSREPLAGEGCAPAPTAAARTTHRFKLDSDRQIARLSAAMISLNGHLAASGAEELVGRAQAWSGPDALPREVVLELNTNRATRPIFWPGAHQSISRPLMGMDCVKRLFEELSALDDTGKGQPGVVQCGKLFKQPLDAIHAHQRPRDTLMRAGPKDRARRAIRVEFENHFARQRIGAAPGLGAANQFLRPAGGQVAVEADHRRAEPGDLPIRIELESMCRPRCGGRGGGTTLAGQRFAAELIGQIVQQPPAMHFGGGKAVEQAGAKERAAQTRRRRNEKQFDLRMGIGVSDQAIQQAWINKGGGGIDQKHAVAADVFGEFAEPGAMKAQVEVAA